MFDLDMDDDLNKQLISMCARKGLLDNESYECVVVQLIKYAKELLDLKAGQPISKKARFT